MTSFASVATCINNMGLGFGLTAPGFSEISPAEKYLLCFAMLLGRLEIYTLLVLFSVSFGVIIRNNTCSVYGAVNLKYDSHIL